MRAKSLTLLGLLIIASASFTELSNSETLFFDDFEDGKVDAAWKFVHGDWVEENGILSQEDDAAGIDPVAKAVLLDKDYPEELTIQAKVRIDVWIETNPSRGGVGVRTDENNGYGFNLLFRGDPPGQIWFLDDFVTWGNGAPLEWKKGNWYYFQMQITSRDEMFGKAWADGTPEPEDFMLEQVDWGGKRPEGPPGLNGGNTGSAVSFDDVEVWDAGGQTPKAVSMSSEKIAIAWGLLKNLK